MSSIASRSSAGASGAGGRRGRDRARAAPAAAAGDRAARRARGAGTRVAVSGVPRAVAARAAARSASTARGSAAGSASSSWRATRSASAPSARSSRAARPCHSARSAGPSAAIDRGAQDRMGEIEPRPRREQSRPSRSRSLSARRVRRLEVRDGRRLAQRRVGVEHGHRADELARAGRQPLELPGDRARDRLRPEALESRRRLRVRCGAVGLDRRQQRVQVERVAARRGMAGRAERRAPRRPAAPRTSDSAAAGPSGRGRSATPVAAEQVVEQRRVARGLAAAHGDHRQQRQPVEPPREIAEPAQRRRIGPVRVVDAQHERALAGEVRGQPEQAVQRRVRHVVAGRGVARRRVERAQRQAGGVGRQARPLVRVAPRAHRLDQLSRDAEPVGLLERRGTRRQRAHAAGAGQLAGRRRAGWSCRCRRRPSSTRSAPTAGGGVVEPAAMAASSASRSSSCAGMRPPYAAAGAPASRGPRGKIVVATTMRRRGGSPRIAATASAREEPPWPSRSAPPTRRRPATVADAFLDTVARDPGDVAIRTRDDAPALTWQAAGRPRGGRGRRPARARRATRRHRRAADGQPAGAVGGRPRRDHVRRDDLPALHDAAAARRRVRRPRRGRPRRAWSSPRCSTCCSAPRPRRSSTSSCSTAARGRCASRSTSWRTPRRPGRPRGGGRGARARRRDDAHLHVGDHRAAEGRRAHARRRDGRACAAGRPRCRSSDVRPDHLLAARPRT